MKKYLLVAILAVSFATPALPGESWYLAFNGNRCEIFANPRNHDWNTLGIYPSRQHAERAKNKSDRCRKD